jgi:hypothetical protein
LKKWSLLGIPVAGAEALFVMFMDPET